LAASLPGMVNAKCLHLIVSSSCAFSFFPQFHLEQARARSATRLADGRPKPIDRIAHTLFAFEGADAQEVGWVATV
jgi:hypothetical protein